MCVLWFFLGGVAEDQRRQHLACSCPQPAASSMLGRVVGTVVDKATASTTSHMPRLLDPPAPLSPVLADCSVHTDCQAAGQGAEGRH